MHLTSPTSLFILYILYHSHPPYLYTRPSLPNLPPTTPRTTLIPKIIPQPTESTAPTRQSLRRHRVINQRIIITRASFVIRVIAHILVGIGSVLVMDALVWVVVREVYPAGAAHGALAVWIRVLRVAAGAVAHFGGG